MKKVVAGLIVLLGLGLVGFGIYKFAQSRKPNAGLKVETNPAALVFVDNEQIGQSPIEKLFKPGEVTVKLIPNSTTEALSTYQTKIRLNPQVLTVIRRDFGKDESESAGETVTLEPQSSKTASLSVVVAGPDSASVILDGQPQGFTPLLVNSITVGDHQITVSAPGFTTREVQAKSLAGYKLIVNVKLAGSLLEPSPTPEISASPSASPSPSGSPRTTPRPSPSGSPRSSPTTTIKKPYVEIKDTPTGFLRVRQTPSTSAKEMGQVHPGDKYPLLSQQSSWYEISVDLEATASGWISSQYADKFE